MKIKNLIYLSALFSTLSLSAQSHKEFNLDKFNYSICRKMEGIQSGVIRETALLSNTSKESRGMEPDIDTILFKFSISDDGVRTAWNKTELNDKIQFNDHIYIIDHRKKEVLIEDLHKSEYCNDLNNGLSSEYIELKRCNDTLEFSVDSVVNYHNSWTIITKHNRVTGYQLTYKYVDSIRCSVHVDYTVNDITYKNYYDILEHKLNAKEDTTIVQEIRDYLNGILETYNLVENKQKTAPEKVKLDSGIFMKSWNFYDLDSNVAVFEENKSQVLIFTFIGCLGCEWLISDLSGYLDSSKLSLTPVFIYIYDPIDRIKLRSLKYGNKFRFLVTQADYLKSTFQVSGFPTIIILDENKKLIYRRSGYGKSHLSQIVEQINSVQ